VIGVDLFLWPWMLVALLVTPLLAWLYRRLQRRPAREVVLHSDLALLARAGAGGRRPSRHLPAALYLVAFALAVAALARPTLAVPEAKAHAGIMLALDISLSMRSGDVAPSRIDAAEAALRGFVADLPAGTRVGLVTFAGYATTVVPLTDDHQRVLDAVGSYHLGRGTVIGDALLESLRAFPDVAERRRLGGDPSEYAAIVLLSDGANRGGTPPEVAVRTVQDQEVVVHTIGVGSTSPSLDPFMGGAMRFDEAQLRRIAEATGGRFAFVDSSEDLHDAYRALSRALTWGVRRDEATGLASLAAAVVLVTSLGMSWFRRGV
jgi:Ca-activated chloride channel homolog